MGKYICSLFLFFCTAIAWADETEPSPAPPPAHEPFPMPRLVSSSQRKWTVARWAGIGYRYDYQQFKDYTSSDLLNSSLVFRGRNTIQVLLGFAWNWEGILLSFRGGYGWMTKGLADFNAPGYEGGYPLFFDKFKVGDGYTADVQGVLGYRIKLYSSDPFALRFTPTVGYKYAHVMNYPKGQQKYPIPNTGFALARFTAPSQQDWFGPCFEGRIETRILRHGFVTLFYQYALPSMRSVTRLEEDVYTSPSPGNLSGVQLYREKSVAHGNALRTQLGGVDVTYLDNSGLRIGVHFEGSKTWSDTSHLYISRNLQQYIESPVGQSSSFSRNRLAVAWIQYMTYIHAGYRF